MKKREHTAAAILIAFTVGLIPVLALLLWPPAHRTDMAVMPGRAPESAAVNPVLPTRPSDDRIPVRPTGRIDEGWKPAVDGALASREAGRPGWLVYGIASTLAGEPVPGAMIDVSYDWPTGKAMLMVSCIAGGDGRYAIFAPLPASMRNCRFDQGFLERTRIAGDDDPPGTFPGMIIATAVAEGFDDVYSEIHTLPSPFMQPEPIRIDFGMERVHCPMGRVLRPGGRPAADALVFMTDMKSYWRWIEVTDEKGRYWVDIGEPGVYYFCAILDGCGGAAVGPVSLSPGPGSRIPDIRLNDSLSISGRVIYPDGRPANDIEVRAVHEDWREFDLGRIMEPGGKKVFPLNAGIFELGIPLGSATTDGAGRFRITGLMDGRYLIDTDIDTNASGFDFKVSEMTPPGSVPAGTAGLLLKGRFTRPRFKVVVYDENGMPAPAARIKVTQERRLSFFASWWEEWVFGGESDWHYVLEGMFAVSAEYNDASAYKAFRLAEKDCEKIVTLRLRETSSATGLIRVRAADSGGNPVNGLQACLLHAGTDVPVRDIRIDGGCADSPFMYQAKAPAGRFDLALRISDWGMDQVHPVTVLPDEVAFLSVRLELGGRIKLKMTDEINGRRTGRARIRIFRQGEPECLLQKEVSGHIFLEKTYREVLAPGIYRIEVIAEGYGAAESRFTIAPGRDTKVEIRLQPE